VSIDWCNLGEFSDNAEIPTVGWQSDQYLAYAQLSLVYFGLIEDYGNEIDNGNGNDEEVDLTGVVFSDNEEEDENETIDDDEEDFFRIEEFIYKYLRYNKANNCLTSICKFEAFNFCHTVSNGLVVTCNIFFNFSSTLLFFYF
jgi:hypothetical protein